MNRRAFGLAALGLLLSAPRLATAQSDATDVQIALAMAVASLAALRTRYGESYPDVVAARARVESLRTALEGARARHETIDVARVTRTLDGELADVRARLGEFSSRCGSGHPDMQTAHARAQALESALEHVTSDGYFLPE